VYINIISVKLFFGFTDATKMTADGVIFGSLTRKIVYVGVSGIESGSTDRESIALSGKPLDA